MSDWQKKFQDLRDGAAESAKREKSNHDKQMDVIRENKKRFDNFCAEVIFPFFDEVHKAFPDEPIVENRATNDLKEIAIGKYDGRPKYQVSFKYKIDSLGHCFFQIAAYNKSEYEEAIGFDASVDTLMKELYNIVQKSYS